MFSPLVRYYFRVITDLDGPKGVYLVGTNEEGSLNIVTLLLTGRATPYLHNGLHAIRCTLSRILIIFILFLGVIYVGDEDHYVRRICQRKIFFLSNNKKNYYLGITTIWYTSKISDWFAYTRR